MNKQTCTLQVKLRDSGSKMGKYKNICRKSCQTGLPRATFPAKEVAEERRKCCRLCGQWVLAKILSRHLREVHFAEGDVRKFKCKDCTYAAKRPEDLRRHTDAKHPRLDLALISAGAEAPEEEYVPKPLNTLKGEPVYVPTPLNASDVPQHPDVVTCRKKLESSKVLPCEEVQKVPLSARDAVQEALLDSEKREDLKRFLDEQGYILLTKDEVRDLKLDARRRGKEEAEANAKAETSAKDIVQDAWIEGATQPVVGKWAPIPRQLTLADKLLAFDLRMRVLDLPEGMTNPVVKKVRRKATTKNSKSALSVNAAATATSPESSTNATPVVTPPEVKLVIDSKGEEADNPITLD